MHLMYTHMSSNSGCMESFCLMIFLPFHNRFILYSLLTHTFYFLLAEEQVSEFDREPVQRLKHLSSVGQIELLIRTVSCSLSFNVQQDWPARELPPLSVSLFPTLFSFTSVVTGQDYVGWMVVQSWAVAALHHNNVNPFFIIQKIPYIYFIPENKRRQAQAASEYACSTSLL